MSFLSQRLLDRQEGGLYSAADVSGQQPLSTDKQVTEQASAVLTFVEHGRDDDLEVALTGLRNMQGTHGHPGFVEVTDRYWRAHPAGRVRTLRYQLQAAAALLAAAHRLDLDEVRAVAVDVLNRCLSTGRDGSFPTRLTEDWRGGHDLADTPQTTVAAVRAMATADAVGEPGVDQSRLPAAAERLRRLVEESTWPRPPATLTRCGSVSRIVLALAQAGRLLDDTAYIKAAQATLASAMAHFYDPDDGGFWDRLTPEGTVRVDWTDGPDAGRPPFPIKRAVDAAHLILAGRAVEAAGEDAGDVISRAESAIAELRDHVHGGVYLGMGYQWVTPTDPAVVSPRQVWPHPQWPGVLIDRSLGHLALQQKSTHTHATVARAFGAGDPEADTAVTVPGSRPTVTAGGTSAVRHRDVARVDGSVQLPVDRERYLGTLRSRAAVGESARWHARAYPGWHVSMVYRTVANLRLLDADAAPPAEAVDLVLRSQNADGGFGEQPGQVSDVASTYHAVVALHLAGALPGAPDRVVDYLRGCQCSDGGFGPVPGMISDVWHTSLAVTGLRLLGATPTAGRECLRFLAATRTEDGGYGNRPGRPATAFAVRGAVTALPLLGAAVPDPSRTIRWLRACQLPCGGFTHRPGREPNPAGTHHAVAALAMLGAVPDVDACERWLTAQQNPEGLFDVLDGPPPSGADDGFVCLQSLAVLYGAANPTWIMLTR
jgi:prenyltransferase beta subunit